MSDDSLTVTTWDEVLGSWTRFGWRVEQLATDRFRLVLDESAFDFVPDDPLEFKYELIPDLESDDPRGSAWADVRGRLGDIAARPGLRPTKFRLRVKKALPAGLNRSFSRVDPAAAWADVRTWLSNSVRTARSTRHATNVQQAPQGDLPAVIGSDPSNAEESTSPRDDLIGAPDPARVDVHVTPPPAQGEDAPPSDASDREPRDHTPHPAGPDPRSKSGGKGAHRAPATLDWGNLIAPVLEQLRRRPAPTQQERPPWRSGVAAFVATAVEPLRRRPAHREHEHSFDAHEIPGDLVRQICTDCGHISIDLTVIEASEDEKSWSPNDLFVSPRPETAFVRLGFPHDLPEEDFYT